jgi:hypothetical protein
LQPDIREKQGTNETNIVITLRLKKHKNTEINPKRNNSLHRKNYLQQKAQDDWGSVTQKVFGINSLIT